MLFVRNAQYYILHDTIYNEFYVSFPLIINVPIIIILIYCYQRGNLCTNNINYEILILTCSNKIRDLKIFKFKMI